MKEFNNILLFSRRFHFTNRLNFAKVIFPGKNIDLWSDERWVDFGKNATWWGAYFYEALKEIKKSTHVNILSALEVHDIIVRCRFLRELPFEKANELAQAAFLAWSRIIEHKKYDFVFHQPIDSFVLDTLDRAAKMQKIPAMHTVGTMLSGRLRFTSRGELSGNIVLPEDAEEYEKIESSIINVKYRPDWLIGTDKTPLRTILSRTFIDMPKAPAFAMYRMLASDPDSFSFAPFKYYKARMHGTPARFFASKGMEKRSFVHPPEEFAFFPLQFYPESSTDYWVPEAAVIDHHKNVLAIARALGKNMPILIKEHPAALGKRSEKFIQELLKIPNVMIAPTLYPAGELVMKSKLVIGHGSSTMFQAMVMRRPVLFLGSPFYGSGKRKVLTKIDDENHIRDIATEAINLGDTSKEEAYDLIKTIFSTTAPGRAGYYSPIGEKSSARLSNIEFSDRLRLLFEDAISNLVL